MKKVLKLKLSFACYAAAAGLVIACADPSAALDDRPQGTQTLEKATGKGVIKAVNKEERQLQIAHEAIPALKWGAMTMAFKVAPSVEIGTLTPGAKVTFTLGKSPQGSYAIEKIQPAE